MVQAKCDEGVNKGGGGVNGEKRSCWAEIKGKGGFRSDFRK